MLKAKLVVVGGDAKAKEVSLGLPTVIGRGKDVELTLPHALVSRKHTEIFEKDGWLFVKDLGSLNGTYVNNRRIKDARKLPPNHLLTLGNVTFRAVYEAPVCEEVERPTKASEDETINFEDALKAESGRDMLPDSADESKVDFQPVVESVEAPEKSPEVAAEKPPINQSSDQPEAPVLRDEVATEPAAASSSIFSDDDDFITPEKSISVSAIEALPSQAAPASMSLIGNQLKDIGGPEKQAIDSIDLDVPGNASSAVQSDPDLGSFLKKLPR